MCNGVGDGCLSGTSTQLVAEYLEPGKCNAAFGWVAEYRAMGFCPYVAPELVVRVRIDLEIALDINAYRRVRSKWDHRWKRRVEAVEGDGGPQHPVMIRENKSPFLGSECVENCDHARCTREATP